MHIEKEPDPIRFLAGGGEMGQLTREKDWSKTPVGKPETWPQSLRTILGIILKSRFPMFLFWGPELTCFYNDAYRPSLGQNGKHPSILGMAAEEAWPEIWATIKPLIDQVLAGGEATWSEDQLIPIYRNGKLEDVYWTFSYSPACNDNADVAGVMVTCSETTEKVLTLKRLEESNRRYLRHITQAPVAMCILRGKNHLVELANDRMLELWGKTADEVINKPVFEGVWEAKGQGLESMLDSVFVSGEKFEANERPIDLPRNQGIETTYVNFVCEALTEPDGTISGILAIATEVTHQVRSRAKLVESEHKVRALVDNAPFAIAVYTGKEMRVELANEAIINIWGKGNDVIGKTLTDILPELSNQLVFEQIREVFNTGIPFHTKNTPLEIVVDGKRGTYYFNYSFTPLYDLAGRIYGVMNTGVDLTDLNVARQETEEAEESLRSMVLQSPIGICVLDAETLVSEIVNDSFLEVAGKTREEILGMPYWVTFAEAKPYYESALAGVVETGIPFYANEVEIMLVRHGKKENIFVTFVYAPLKSFEGTVKKVAIWVLDNTQQVVARQKIEEADKRFRTTVKQAPVGIAILRGPHYIVEMANDAYLQLVDRQETEFVGRPLFDALPEVEEAVHRLLDGVLYTGVPYHGNEVPIPLLRQGKQEIFYFDFLYHPLKEVDGEISGIIVTVTEVTYKVVARKKTEQNEEKLSIVVEASELGMWELNLKTREATYSKRYLEILGGYTEEIKLTHDQLLAHLHPDDMHIRQAAFRQAAITGQLHFEARLIWNDKSIHWMEAKGKVFYDSGNTPEKMIGTIRDITDEKNHQHELEAREKQFRQLAESLPQLVWETDEKGNSLFASGRWVEYSGIIPKGESEWKAVLHPDDFEENRKIWMNSLATGELYRCDVRLKNRHGEYRWHAVIGEPIRDRSNKILKWVGAFTDIHAEKAFTQELTLQVEQRTKELNLLNETLKESEERYHLMIEEVQDYAIIYLSKTGIVENWNKGAEKIKGYKGQEIIGKDFSVFYTEQDRESNLPQTLLIQAMEAGRVRQEGWRVRKDKSLFWANVVITAIHDDRKNIIGFSKVTHDLTERKQAEDKIKATALELERKNTELENMNRELQSFAYISSHDLQEPLRKIQMFAGHIRESEFENLTDSGKSKFDRMKNAAERMQTLINDLLLYSRVGSGERKFEKTEIGKIIEEIRDDLKEELNQKNATLRVEGACEIKMIRFQFRQLLFNLLSNSLKFAHPNRPPHIVVTCKIVQGSSLPNLNLVKGIKYGHIQILDNGIGFDPQYSERIFEVFQRLHGKTEYVGTGIGLAIVKRIVDNHNGTIIATGVMNEGASFDIYVPVNQTPDKTPD